jgi:hypothetical protein
LRVIFFAVCVLCGQSYPPFVGTQTAGGFIALFNGLTVCGDTNGGQLYCLI